MFKKNPEKEKEKKEREAKKLAEETAVFRKLHKQVLLTENQKKIDQFVKLIDSATMHANDGGALFDRKKSQELIDKDFKEILKKYEELKIFLPDQSSESKEDFSDDLKKLIPQYCCEIANSNYVADIEKVKYITTTLQAFGMTELVVQGIRNSLQSYMQTLERINREDLGRGM